MSAVTRPAHILVAVQTCPHHSTAPEIAMVYRNDGESASDTYARVLRGCRRGNAPEPLFVAARGYGTPGA